MGDNEELPPTILIVIVAWALTLNGWGLWCTYVAFVGGKLPLLPIVLPGGVGNGLLFLLIGEPLLMMVGYFAGQCILCPLLVLVMLACGRIRAPTACREGRMSD